MFVLSSMIQVKIDKARLNHKKYPHKDFNIYFIPGIMIVLMRRSSFPGSTYYAKAFKSAFKMFENVTRQVMKRNVRFF